MPMALTRRVASLHGSGSPDGLSRSSGRLRRGATSRPSRTSRDCCSAFQYRRKLPPPSPELWGSTTASTACAVTRASTAVPPFFSMAIAASLAIGLAVTTTASPAAVETCLRPRSDDSGSSRLIGATAVDVLSVDALSVDDDSLDALAADDMATPQTLSTSNNALKTVQRLLNPSRWRSGPVFAARLPRTVRALWNLNGRCLVFANRIISGQPQRLVARGCGSG